MNPIAVTAVQAMVAPVVLITTAAILSGALLTMYGSVNDRMRAMDHERVEILTGAAGTLLSAVSVPQLARSGLPSSIPSCPCSFAGTACCTMLFFSSTPEWPCWC